LTKLDSEGFTQDEIQEGKPWIKKLFQLEILISTVFLFTTKGGFVEGNLDYLAPIQKLVSEIQ